MIDCAIKESESIAKSNNMLDELIDAGNNVLTSLTTQRGLLKVSGLTLHSVMMIAHSRRAAPPPSALHSGSSIAPSEHT